MQFKRKLLIFKRINSFILFLLVITVLLFLSGCAQKQWQEPLEQNAEKSIRALLLDELQKRDNCTCCIDAEISIKWDAQLSDGGLNGYLQVMLPTSIKLVAINPLGQPVYALTTDGTLFQAINVSKGLYKHGKISRFIDKHDIPQNVFHEEWANWLSGNMNFTNEQLVELREDIESRGIWLHVVNNEKNNPINEYLLFDFSKRQLIERVGIDKDGDEVARVIYQGWTSNNGCPLPTDIKVQGIAYNTEVQINLSDIKNDQIFTAPTFNLKLPPNYLQQYYP